MAHRRSITEVFRIVGHLMLFTLAGAGVALCQNPVPLIDEPLVPDARAPVGSAFTLTVNGTGFVPGSVVQWNGNPRPTTFVSKSRLTAQIQGSDIAKASTASVTVVSPGPGGGKSNGAFFTVTTPTSLVALAAASYATGDRSYSVAVGDFNRDGKLDLAVADYVTNTISVLLGNGDGTFQTHVDYATGTLPLSVAVGDFNGDGKLDLAVGNELSDTISVLLGNGDGTFQPHVEYPTGNWPSSVAVGDFNGDGKLDLAVSIYVTNTISVLLGNGDGTFQPAVSYSTGSAPGSVAVGDFNRDGKLDLAVGGSNDVSILLGNGDGTFQPAVSYNTASVAASVAVADFNADDKLDLAVASGTGVSVLLGNGDGTFQTHVDYGTGSTNNSSVAVGDFNGDGRPDLVVADLFSTDVRLLLGNGDGTFAAAASYAAGSGPSSVALGDFNGDGGVDIAVADSSVSTVSVLLQTSVSLSKAGLTFAGQVIHTSGAPQNVTLTNVGPRALNIGSIAITGADASDFSQTHTCGLTLQGSCTITVNFTPTLTGPRNASITITDNAVASPQNISLSGTGLASGPNATLSGTSLTFGTQLPGSTSPAQSITLTNYGSAALSITGIGFSGADPSDFAETNTCGSSVAPGASCTINVTFKPTGINQPTASLSITDNAPGSPQTISLSEVISPAISLSTTNLTFASQPLGTASPAQSITLTNYGTAALSITGIGFSGADPSDFAETNTCGSSIAAGASCTINVTFKPIQIDTRSGTLLVRDDASGSPQQVSLVGNGTVVKLVPPSLSFFCQPAPLKVCPPISKPITLTNTGSQVLTINSISISGVFYQTNNCPSQLKVQASCTITVTSRLGLLGRFSGAVSISDNGGGSPQQVALTDISLNLK